MVSLQQVIDFLREIAPPDLAESWDNVGLLVGDPTDKVASVLTCLTLTQNVAEEAIARQVQLIVTHHPVLFRPVQRLTTETDEGRLLLSLIRAGIAVYSPHTSYDSAAAGINQQWSLSFDLRDVRPLRPRHVESLSAEDAGEILNQSTGSGRWGKLPRAISLRELIDQAKSLLGVAQLQYVGDLGRTVTKLAIACGSAAEFLPDAARCGCEAFLTGEARFHACLEAETANVAMILPGHYATERPAMLNLAQTLKSRFTELAAQASDSECDPVKFG